DEHSCCGVVEEAAYKARERSEARRSKPQPWIVLKLTIGITLGLLGYTAYVYIHRFVVPMIKGDTDALGSLGAGVAMIAAFALLWLWTLWAYIRVVTTSPGKAKVYVPETPEPPPLYPQGSPTPGTNTNINLPPNAYLAPSSEPKGEPMARIGGPSYEQQRMAEEQPARLSTAADLNRLSVPSSSHHATHDTRDSTAYPTLSETKKLSLISDASAPLPPASVPPPGFPRSKREEKEMQRALHIARRPPPVPYLRDEQRYCTRCNIVKPYRAHHCRACGTCILRYDHHCPWIGQCVGAQNYKFFFNFCEAAWVFTTYTFVTLVAFVATHGEIDIDPQIIVIIALSALFMCFTAAMAIAHTRQILMGQTTVELMQIRGMKERENAVMARVFSLWEISAKKRTRERWDAEWGALDREGNLWWQGSARKEWTSVMGERWIGWIFPIGRGGDDGMHYQPNPRFDPEGRW
ncbi:DHHC palmitoyltransferase-domain-containing protein, partial [Schizophyllum fasciatum]